MNTIFLSAQMGRTRKYATPEEAHEAKKKQMRENYQKRKAAKQEATKVKAEPENPKAKPKKPKKQVANTIEEAVIDIVNDNPADIIHMSKEDLLTKVLTAVGEALA